MDNRKKHGRARGSMTVEAVFVIPIMIFSIFAIIYLSVLLYQNTVTMAEATRSANRIASYWSYIDGYNPPALTDGALASELINKDSYTRRSPYRFIVETLATLGGLRMQNGRQYAETQVEGIPFEAYTDGSGAHTQVEAKYGFLSSYIEVSFEKHYINPLGTLLARIGVGEKQDYSAKATALITNPTEFIRNVDILWDVGEGLL